MKTTAGIIATALAIAVAVAFLTVDVRADNRANLVDAPPATPAPPATVEVVSPPECQAEESRKVYLFGDSLSSGRIQGRYEHEFDQLGYELFIHAEPGAPAFRAKQWVDYVAEAIKEDDVAAIYFNFGANNLDPGLGKYIRRAVKAARKNAPDAEIFWYTLVAHHDRPGLERKYRRNNRIIQNRARKLGLTVVRTDLLWDEKYFAADGLHWTTEGQDVVARHAASLLKKNC